MACGTPVIAFRNGSVPEVVDHGITGFVANGEAEAVGWVGRIAELDRGRIRAQFERRFSAGRMARDYVKLYQRMTRRSLPVLREVARPAAAAV
jgi:glycosyltransferase involved in cell wall biosynthesis